jgi:hypothetical protein
VSLTPNVVKGTGVNVTITGTLTNKATGAPIQTSTTATSVRLQSSADNGQTWQFIQAVNSTSTGSFGVSTWTAYPQPKIGNSILVRAFWGGDVTRNLDIAVSAPVRLIEQ